MTERVIQWGLRTAFGLLYNELAWAYDGISWLVSWGKWRSWQRAALPHLVGPAVLELGFGTGNFLRDLAEAYHQVWGLELSPCMVSIAQQKLHRSDLSLPLVLGRAQSLPFATSTFDSVVATFPSPFILQLDTLAETARVLRTGGRLVMLPAAYHHRRGFGGRLLDCLYAVTGQRGFPPWKTLLEPVGLCATVEEIDLATSVVQIVIAVKN